MVPEQPLGHSPEAAAVTTEQLAGADGPRLLAELNTAWPLSWLDCIDGWLVTDRAMAVAVMRDAERFTVDDPRFTTGQVVGPSMLSLDGEQHRRHRSPFIAPFRPSNVEANYADFAKRTARELVSELQPRGRAELRTELAGPLAVAVIADALGLADADDAQVLDWYRSIVAGVNALSAGQPVPSSSRAAVQSLRDRVVASVERTASAQDSASSLRDVYESADLTVDELFSNTAVVMFGAIETCEGMTTNALYHVLHHLPGDRMTGPELVADPEMLSRAIEESLRLEPAAAVVDRYATCNVVVDTPAGSVEIQAGDLVRVSLLAANRDPSHYPDPDRFDLQRSNAGDHLAFVQGPHACIGAHLARVETRAALAAVFDLLPDLTVDSEATAAPTGLIFRKPEQLTVTWSGI